MSIWANRVGLPPAGHFRSTPINGHHQTGPVGPVCVESRCGAVSVGRTYLLPPLSFGGASMVPPWLRFHIPLIEPDRQISRIRLSDKTSLTGLRLVIADHALGLPVFRALS